MVEEKNAANDKDSLTGLSKGANFKNSKIIYASKGGICMFSPLQKKIVCFQWFQTEFWGVFYFCIFVGKKKTRNLFFDEAFCYIWN